MPERQPPSRGSATASIVLIAVLVGAAAGRFAYAAGSAATAAARKAR